MTAPPTRAPRTTQRPLPPRTAPATEPGERLAKRVALLLSCSRAEAEQYIEGGFVSVNGVLEETPQRRVLNQTVEVAANASLAKLLPVTLLLHKPPGFDADEGGKPAAQLLTLASKFAADRSGHRTLKRHLAQQHCVTPLETGASGLLVFSQDARIRRKLLEDAALVEHEVMVDVRGEVSPEALAYLNRTPVIDGRAMLPARVSLSHQVDAITGLRFAVKGCHPGQIAQMCDTVGVQVVAMKRIRVGRVPLAGLPVGQWRYLLPYERF